MLQRIGIMISIFMYNNTENYHEMLTYHYSVLKILKLDLKNIYFWMWQTLICLFLQFKRQAVNSISNFIVNKN